MDADLYAAATTGDIDGIRRLKEKIDQVTESNGETILHLAALFNMSSCVAAILDEFPGLLDKVNSRNETAFHLAAEKGYKDVVQLLIKKATGSIYFEITPEGSNFIRKGNVDMDTALHLAVRNNHRDVVWEILQADRTDKHSQNLKFETPLYLAMITPRADYVMQIILEICSNASVVGPEGKTALHAAVINRLDRNHVRLITQMRKDIWEKADDKGLTAFHYAASLNCIQQLDALIDYGNPDTMGAVMAMKSTTDKQTVHHIAAYKGHIDVLMKLMKHCPSPSEAVDNKNMNILHIAAKQKHKELIQYMLQDYPDVMDKLVNMQDRNGNTPLHLLVKSGCYVPELIKHQGIDRNIRNYDDFTPQELLYLEDNIVEDQLLIKNELEDIQVNYFQKFWHKVTKWGRLQQFNLWLTEIKSKKRRLPGVRGIKQRRKDAKFRIANTDIMNNKVALNKDRTNTQIIVTALIATVTFTVGFTMPGGNHDGDSGDANNGLAILTKKAAFSFCMVADAVGLLFSTASLFLFFISSLYEDPRKVSKFIAVSTGFNIVSVVAMLLTFITGTYVVLSGSPALAITISVISCMFFLFIFVLFIKLMFD